MNAKNCLIDSSTNFIIKERILISVRASLVGVAMQCSFISIFLLPEDFFPLSKHVKIHGRKEGNVETHDNNHDEMEVKCEVESVGESNAKHILK